jgi:uncharacterized NAD-dependent epimerase/dehydratase family protein
MLIKSWASNASVKASGHLLGNAAARSSVDLRKLTGRSARVAVIDTGVDQTHPAVTSVACGVRLTVSESGAIVCAPDYGDDYGHGTACAGIIQRVAPECSLMAIRVASESDEISSDLLMAGIEWALENGADVINISAGTGRPRNIEGLLDCCARAATQGTVVIASESNDGRPTYPAVSENVVAVSGGATERGLYAFRRDPSIPRRFLAFSGHQKVPWKEPPYIFSFGTSFAAARISAIVALLVGRYGRLDWSELLALLARHSLNPPDLEPAARAVRAFVRSAPEDQLHWIKKAAIFPYAKETESLVRFRHLLPFEITGVADPIAKRRVGRDMGEVIGLPRIGQTVSADLEIAMKDADTLVIGFMTRLGMLQKRDALSEVVQRAISLGKNIYSFESLRGEQYRGVIEDARRRGLQVAWPGCDEGDLERLRELRFPAGSYAEVPILGVFGTSPDQGKFTLQLIIRDQLSKSGYKVAQVGTEHQSALFGMSCFPFGHRRENLTLSMHRWCEYFDLEYRRFTAGGEPDLVLVGSQGGVIPYRRVADDLVLTSYLFLIASRADSYVLVVNHLDELSFIQDTMDALRIIGGGRTILLALSNRRRRIVTSFGRRLIVTENVDTNEQEEHVRRLERHFGLPVVTILEEQAPRRILDVITEAYTPRPRVAAHSERATV